MLRKRDLNGVPGGRRKPRRPVLVIIYAFGLYLRTPPELVSHCSLFKQQC